jgi:sugar (pentulose or hexulose) kinase
MPATPVIAIFDIGKTNKKILLFDEDYKIVYEESAKFAETIDDDGDLCEDLDRLRLFVFDSLRCVFAKKEFAIRAINFSAYGASLVYIDNKGRPITSLYNYLKPYPDDLFQKFYSDYGGQENFSSCTASPALGSLNSGMQVYRLKYEKPQFFQQIQYVLHLPQYLSYLISGKVYSDMTSIGCHTNLWDFSTNKYHEWVEKECIRHLLPPFESYDKATTVSLEGKKCLIGTGLHDSSAALIPYLISFQEPFVLISSGTWCISLNPFNHSLLTKEELQKDCLCYIDFKGNPVKAARLFAGHIHDNQSKRIAGHFHLSPAFYQDLTFDGEIIRALKQENHETASLQHCAFEKRDLAGFASPQAAYHQLMLDLVDQQRLSTQLVLEGNKSKRIFVDGGFSNNEIYLNLLSAAFPGQEIFAASIPHASALGAALAIHEQWNSKTMPGEIIRICLKRSDGI